MCCGEQGRFSIWSPGTAVLTSAGLKTQWVHPFSVHEQPEGTVNLGLQIDGYSLHSECKHFTETEQDQSSGRAESGGLHSPSKVIAMTNV